MKNNERLSVYFIGFILGMVMVSFIMMRRAAREQAAEDPWMMHHEAVEAAGVEPLPDRVEAVMLQGQVLRFGYLPNAEAARERVWLLNFKESYPYVRVVENLDTGALSYMAADQIKIILAEGVDVAALAPMLDTLHLRLRNFNRKHRVVVLGVLNADIDAVPATLNAIHPWGRFFEFAGPDLLEFRDR